MIDFKTYLKEIGNEKNYDWEKHVDTDSIWYDTTKKFQDDTGLNNSVTVTCSTNKPGYGHETAEIVFTVNDKYSSSQNKDIHKVSPITTLKILSFIISATKDMFNRFILPNHDITKFKFSAYNEDSVPLYHQFAQKIKKEIGWKYTYDDIPMIWEFKRPEHK